MVNFKDFCKIYNVMNNKRVVKSAVTYQFIGYGTQGNIGDIENEYDYELSRNKKRNELLLKLNKNLFI